MFILQDEEEEGPRSKISRDGVELTVEADELDYVDDLSDGELDEFPDDHVEEQHITEENDVQPGTSSGSSGMNAGNATLGEEELAKNPHFKSLFNRFWEEKMKEITHSGISNLVGGRRNHDKHGAQKVFKEPLPKEKQLEPGVKSPSDTTIYAPTLAKNIRCSGPQITNMVKSPVDRILNVSSNVVNNDMNQVISDFVENVPMEQEQQNQNPTNEDVRQILQEKERRRASTTEENIPGLESAKSKGEKSH